MVEIEKKTEIAVIPVKKVRGKPFKVGRDERRNLNGKPPGTKSFSTLFDEAIRIIAKEEKISPESAELALFEKAYTEARKGNFNYFKDIMDRRFGQPTKPIDLTTSGHSFLPTPEERTQIDKAFKDLE